MADGFSLNIDDSLLKRLNQADTLINQIAESSKKTSKVVSEAFANVNNNAIKPFVQNLNELRKALDKKAEPIAFKEINLHATKAMDATNSLVNAINKINNTNETRTKNSAIYKIEQDIESAKNRLLELQKLLNFYAKGEGQKALGFVDTSSIQSEANNLMKKLDLLEKEKTNMEQNAKIRLEQAREQEKIDNHWASMQNRKNEIEREAARISSQIAKQNSKEYEQSYNERYKMYRNMYVKIEEREKEHQAKIKAEQQKKASDADKERYELWLMRKKSEEAEHRRVEDEKLRKTQETIARQNEMYAAQEQLRRKNAQVVTNATQARAETEQKYRDYERLFTQAIQREEKLKREANAYETQRFIELQDRKKRAESDMRAIERRNHEQKKKEYEELFKAIERTENRQRLLNNARGDSSKGALNYFNRLYSGFKPQSLNNMQIAISKLQDAQKRLNLNTDEGVKKYAELDKRIQYLQRNISATTNSINNMSKSHRGLMDTAGQLTRKLALVFSVSQIQGYIGKLIQVRGEFELQQKSLQVLLQNKDEADKLWKQTIDLAVRSPFRVKELVSYTRQLAAYRIENEKLHDTTKRLADVSAGLGVDMQRLILAFGQVKAANFLRGTELRQFTEAGIPMLDELAKLFTELEGRMVSAGDVFERISKRMVTFGDVEEVFKRLTNAGGVFYNMQEEQSKTLRGMISNLHDSIDLMLNDIGKANDGLLKDGVNAAKNFVENWREIAFYMENVITALVSWKIANAAFVVGTQKAATTTLWFNSALKAKIGASMIDIKTLKLSEAALFGVTKQQWLFGKATMYVQGILRGIGKFAIKTIVPLAAIAGVIELYRHLTKASREAKRLQKDLQAIYNEDTKNLEKQVDTFTYLVEKLKKVTKGSKEHKDIISQLNSQYSEYLGFLITEKTTYDELASSINSVVTALTQKAKATTYEKSFNRIIEDSSKDMSKLREEIERGFLDFGILSSKGTKILPTKREINDIFNLINQKVNTSWEELTSSDLDEILDSYFGEDVFRPSSVDFSKFVDYSKIVLKIREKEFDLQEQLDNLYGKGIYDTRAMRQEMEKLNQEREKALEQETTRIGKEKIEYDYLVKKTKLEGKYQGLEQSTIDANVAKIQKTNKTIQDINRRLIESTSELGADAVDRVYITAQDASQGINAVAESMAAAYKQAQEDIKVQNGLIEAGTAHSQETLDNATKMSKAYYKVLEFMGRLDLLESKGDKKEQSIKILNRRIDLVKEINKEYEKLTEQFGSDKAKETILKAYKDTFKEAFEGTGINLKGLVIDKEKLTELKNEGETTGKIFSEAMLDKMNKVVESGTYIRNVSENVKEQIKKDEGLIGYIYDDAEKAKVKTQIKTIEELYKYFDKVTGEAKKVAGQGTLTIGYGHALQTLDEAKKYLGVTLQQADAEELLNKDIKDRIAPLNNLLDKYNELIVTQEQYDVLFNNFYQGGLSQAFQFAFSENTNKLEAHIKKLDSDLSSWGSSFAQEWGDNWLEEFKQLETNAEKFAKALEIVSVTTVASGGHIDNKLFKGMKARSASRAAEFRGDLEIVKLLQKSAIDVSQIDFTNLNGVIETLKKLKPIAEKEGKEAQLTLSRAISKIEAEVELEAEVVNEQKILDKIESLFGQYEVSVELEKMNIPPSLIKQMFNVDSLKLPELKEKIIKEFASGAGEGANKLTEELNKSLLTIDWQLVESLVGKTQIGEIKNKLEKVDEMEDKALQERLKKYSKYLATAMGERVKIKMEEIRAISEIENTKEFSDDQKELAKQGVRKESQAKLDKLEWEEFKDSGMYVQLFEDLEYASTKSLKSMRTQLEQLKGSLKNLDADDLRHLYNQIEKLDDVLAKRNPFKTFINGLDDYRNAVKNTKYLDENLESAQEDYNKAKKDERVFDLALAKQREEYNQKSKNNKLSKQENDTYLHNIALLENQLKLARNITEKKKEGVEQAQKEVDTNNKIKKLFKESGGEVGKYISQAANALPEIAGNLENVFGYMDAGTRDTIESISEIAGGIGDTMQSLASGDYIGAIVGVAKTIGAIFAVGDKKKERQIQKEIEFVDKLGRAYEKLQHKIEEAYSINTLQQSGKNAKANLEAQISAYKRMISAEEGKKKTDKNRIKEWEYAIEDIQQQIADMNKDLISTATAGIMDSVLSASQEFTDAWLSAFQETGNGLSGLEDNFKETMLEMVKQQAAMLISQSYVERWKRQLEQYINPDDLELSTDEAKKWVNAVNTSLPQLNEALENYFNAMKEAGVDISGGTGGELSGLQRGIQGVTEETAQIIEAYLNSIRFFVAENNTYLAQIASSFNSGEMENPMVSQLRIIAQQTSAINTLLNSLTKGGHSLGGVGLKVFIS